MQAPTNQRNRHGSSLVETISNIRLEFSSMKTELQDAYSEITRLNRELNGWQARHDAFPDQDLGALRRQVAFYCHPDRGGDENVMCRLNVLFDFLDCAA